MKKEVYSNFSSWIFLITLLVLSFSVVMSVVVAQGKPPGGSDTPITPSYETTQPTPTNILGYWLACVGTTTPDLCNVWIPENTGLDDSVMWPTEVGDEKPKFPNGVPPFNDADRSFGGESALTLYLKYLYLHKTSDSMFGFNDSLDDLAHADSTKMGEIQKVKFVMEPLVFTIKGSTMLWGSHGGFDENFAKLINDYETDKTWFIKDCMGTPLESLGLCQKEKKDFKVTAVEIDVLRHADCSEFADLNPQFCEGVPAVGANAALTNPGGGVIAINTEGLAGKGGCYVDTYGETPGRDWFWNSVEAANKIDYEELDAVIPFSLTFNVDDLGQREIIGRCCGNDPEDFGALMSYNDDHFRNFYACVNTSAGSSWLSSRVQGNAFTIFRIDRPLGAETVSFDAVSNSDNWFLCEGSTPLDALYDYAVLDSTSNGWDFENSGPLLKEYNVLPPTFEPIEYGVTAGGEGGGPNGWKDTEGGDDIPGSGDAATDVIDDASFEQGIGGIYGASQVTDCDKDGDGYDGYWTTDPTHLRTPGVDWTVQGKGPWYADGLTCTPRTPYDCDDSNRTISPGTMDYCDGSDPTVNTVEEDCNRELLCVPKIGGEQLTNESSQLDLLALIPRFMCHDIDGYGAFAECCGWDLINCHNDGKGRREGSAIHTLYEFTHYLPADETIDNAKRNNSNMVLRYGINTPPTEMSAVAEDATYRLNLPYIGFDEQVQNWSRYKNLEFDIYLTANFELEIWVGFPNPTIALDPLEAGLSDNYIYPFKARVTDYIVGEPRLGRWMHVIIPISDIYSSASYFDVGTIVFASYVHNLKGLGTVKATIGGHEDEFSNVIGLDKIMLRPDAVLNPGDENYYCAGTWPPLWVSDLDDNILLEDGSPRGRSACNSIPSYHWTGNYCCGDDTGNNTDENTRGQFSFKEFFSDTQGACWAGRYMAENERVMVVQFKQSPDLDVVMNVSCSDYTCNYDLPPRPGVIVENPNPETYDLAFVDGGYTPIGRGSVSPDDNSMLRAENVPLQIQYVDGEFYTCNGADFISRLLNTNDGQPLIKEDVEHDFSTCQVKGIYFCDNPEGKNHGWDSEPLSVYAGSNMTMSDGTSIRPQGGDVVAATYRIENKHNYNLVRNGGFEDV